MTPPDEQRTADDLDRIFAAARACAHGDVEVAGEPAETEPIRLAPVEARQRLAREPRIHALGRVAAAAVLVVAVGGGVATARDGVVIDALLGRAPITGPAAPLALPDGADPTESVGTAEDLPEPTPVPLLGSDESDGGAQTQTQPDDITSSDVEVEELAEPQPSTEPQPRPEPQPEADPEPAPAPAPEPRSTPRPQPTAPSAPTGGGTSEQEPDAPVAEDEPTETVIAAPPSERDVDGFTGPAPCPEDQDLAACLDDRQGDEGNTDPKNEDRAAEDDGPSTEDRDGESEQQKLARRRGGG